MDLRGMLNDSGPTASTPSKPPQPPVQQQHPPALQPAMPSTPVQTNPHQAFREYSQTQPSPSRQFSLDYAMQQAPPGAYASPTSYQGPSGPYPNRPAPPPPPPPLQQVSANDLRSPSIQSGPGPSPYRQTPTSSISAASVGYPFPQQQQQQTPTSPVQRHQYPPHQAAYHRDSFPPPSVPVGMTGPPGGVSYMQGQQQMPQTPPVVTPSGHPYPHTRSHSTHSTPTPTSAQSQQGQYGGGPFQGSPVAMHHSLPQMEPQPRQSSQPPTPVAAPLSRPPQPTMSFGQPPSPFQQRVSTIPNYIHPPSQRSPPAPNHPSLPRHPSTTSVYDPHSTHNIHNAHNQEPHPHPHSHSQQQQQQQQHQRSQSRSVGDRDRSISVSPKTRIPSLPSTAGRPGTSVSVSVSASVSDSDPRSAHPLQPAPAMASSTTKTENRERVLTPAKRKLDDRELPLDELERRETRPPPFNTTNGRRESSVQGHAAPAPAPSQQTRPAAFATVPRKKRKAYQTPPVWAQKLQGRSPTNANYSLYRPTQHLGAQVNGKPSSLSSRHNSPEERRMPAPQHQPPPPPPPPPQPAPVPELMMADGPLGPWEPSITNEIPMSDASRTVADFLFTYVIGNEDFNQIQNRGVHFEIEAKLGTLIDKHDNQPLHFPILTECILNSEGEWGNRLVFRSSMSEVQHKSYNDYLNEMVKQCHPNNKERQQPRVPIRYKHRRETDKFFELPNNVRDQVLPPFVANPIASRGHTAKVRVTFDQKTDEVLAKIVKVRIADLSIHLPKCPLDCRISVNLEMDWDGPVEDLERMAAASNRPALPNRSKDRLSYTQSHYQIDLTQVTTGALANAKREHELEIELDADVLIDQGNKARLGQPNQYTDLVDGFLNNIRVLARKAAEFPA